MIATAVVLLGAAAMLLIPDSAAAEGPGGEATTTCRAKYGGFWAQVSVPISERNEVCGGNYKGQGEILDLLEGVPADQPEPAVSCGLRFTADAPYGEIACSAFYSHNRPIVATPTCVNAATNQQINASCSTYEPGKATVNGTEVVAVLRYVNRRVGETGATAAANTDADPDVRYTAGPNHRTVRDGDGGPCYREWREGGVWRRSGSYGTGDEACRKASWNTHYRSDGVTLVDPETGTFPSGQPPTS
jgi:hypothetical protein